MACHETDGRSQVDSRLASLNKPFLPASGHCRHASIRTIEERFVRSVHFGRSRFSRCCHLISALWFCSQRVEPRRGHSHSHRNSALGFCLFSLQFSPISRILRALATITSCPNSFNERLTQGECVPISSAIRLRGVLPKTSCNALAFVRTLCSSCIWPVSSTTQY